MNVLKKRSKVSSVTKFSSVHLIVKIHVVILMHSALDFTLMACGLASLTVSHTVRLVHCTFSETAPFFKFLFCFKLLHSIKYDFSSILCYDAFCNAAHYLCSFFSYWVTSSLFNLPENWGIEENLEIYLVWF